MSKELAKTEPAFLGEGHEWPYPNLYAENQRVSEYSELSDGQITAKANEYHPYLKDDLMPRARAEVQRVLTHLAFEAAYRLGTFNQTPSDVSELIIVEQANGEVLSQGQ